MNDWAATDMNFIDLLPVAEDRTDFGLRTSVHLTHVFSLGLCFVCSFVLFDLFICPHSFMFP